MAERTERKREKYIRVVSSNMQFHDIGLKGALLEQETIARD